MTRPQGSPAWPQADAARQARLCRELLDRAGVGYCLLEAWACEGGSIDALFVDLGAALEGWPPLRNARGLRVRQVLPGLDEAAYAMVRAALATGEAAEATTCLPLVGHRVQLCACRVGHPRERLVGVLVRDAGPRGGAALSGR